MAAKVQSRFEAHGLGLLATVRRGGYPRICGIEPLFGDELWLGMMHGSRKAADLMANPRLSLHSATADKNVADGDAKLTGTAHVVEDEKELSAFREAFAAATGYGPPPGPMHLFRVDVTEMSFLQPATDHLVIESWREGHPIRRRRR